jgi:O-antigen/teichoic acid export membrane protein
MSKYKRLGKNTFFVFLGNVGSKLIGFIMLPFYTKWLTVEEYGTSDNVLVYVGLLLAIVTLSISDSIFIFPKDQEVEKQKQYFSSALIYSLFFLSVTGILLIGIKEILTSYDILHSIAGNIGYIYFLIIVIFLQTFFQQFSQSINKIKIYTASGILLTFFTAVLSFILIPKFGIDGFFAAQIVSYVIAALYTFIHSGSYRYFSIKAIKKSRYKEMVKYSIPLIPNAIMWWLVGSLNRPLMEEYLGIYTIGLFAVAYKLPSLIIALFSVVMVSWQISVIEEHKKADYEKFYNGIFRLVFVILSLGVIFLSITSRILIEIIAAPKFIEASNYVPILSLSALFCSVSGLVGANFSATRESKYYFYSSVWGATIAVIFNIILIPLWGLYGAVVTIVLSHFVMALSRIKYSWNIAKITNIHIYALMITINVCVILVASYVQNSIVKSVFYLLLFIIFVIVNRDMKEDFKNVCLLVISKLSKNRL